MEESNTVTLTCRGCNAILECNGPKYIGFSFIYFIPIIIYSIIMPKADSGSWLGVAAYFILSVLSFWSVLKIRCLRLSNKNS